MHNCGEKRIGIGFDKTGIGFGIGFDKTGIGFGIDKKESTRFDKTGIGFELDSRIGFDKKRIENAHP